MEDDGVGRAVELGRDLQWRRALGQSRNALTQAPDDDLAGSGITLGGTVELEVGGERYLATYAQTFADVKPGELLVYEDAYRTLAVAINRGDAAATLALRPDVEVRLQPQ